MEQTMIETTIQSVLTGVMMGAIYALITLGLSIIFGVMNMVNFAHGEFIMIAMYLTYFFGTLLIWDAVATPLITAPILFGFGLIVYYLLIDRTLRELYVVPLAATVGLGIFLRSAALILWKAQPRALVYSVIQGSIQLGAYTILTSRLFAAIASLLFIAAFAYFLNKTWAGMAMRAASDDLDAAALMGVNYHHTYALTFAIGSALIAVAGGLLMSFQQTDPSGGMRFGLLSWAVMALAGLGSLPGLLVAGMIIGIAETLAMSFFDHRSRLLAVYAVFI
jgi:branched-chain amino acid transport system permease protein